MRQKIEIPDEIEIVVEDHILTVKGDGHNVEKEFSYPGIELKKEDGNIILETETDRRQDKAIIGTYKTIIKNAIKGVKDPYEYRLKSVYSHFPTSLAVKGNKVEIQNFMGERYPRKIDLPEGVQAKVEDDDLVVTGSDKEKVGLAASRVEQACYKGNRDPRKFQDGVYLYKRN